MARALALFAALLAAAASALDILHLPSTRLAAAELRRYLHAASRGAPLAALAPATPSALAAAAAGPTLVLLTRAEAAALGVAAAASARPADAAAAGAYTLSAPRANVTQVLGEDAQGVLYGVYAYLEALGFTFTSFGPTVPAAGALRGGGLPLGFERADAPVFSTRGLQPFHDFAEGPDWWGEDEHKRVIEAVLSMKGNLIGYHTYPLIEPAVWVGLKENVLLPSGNITGGSYSTRWATTLEENKAWAYNPFPTSAMGFGASQIYEHDCFGHESVSGDARLCPSPKTPADNDEVFNRVGLLWRAAFAHAKALGVQTVLGTEIPLAMPAPPAPPAPLPDALLPLQLWYSAARNDHFVTTTDCAECAGLYALVGVTGWVYAGNVSGSTPICTYASTLNNSQIDNKLAPCSGGSTGVRIEGYVPAPGTADTLPLAQYVNAEGHHWAVWPALVPNATALGFAPSGAPIGSVFASGPPLPSPPNATAYYEGIFTRLTALLGSNLTYYWGWTPEGWEWSRVPITSPLIQDAVNDMRAMQAAHDALAPPFGLASCGWTVGPLGARWYYDTVLPSTTVISSIDMDVGNTPVDPAYANITHRPTANKWAIPWSEDDPGLTAPELWVNRSLLHARDSAAYGVGGLLSIHWRTRMTSPQIGSAHAVAWNLSLTSPDYWAAWSLGQFGDPAVAAAMAGIFTSVDSYALPRPVSWTSGPGGFLPGCAAAQLYAFVDAAVALRPALLAAVAAQPPTATLAHLEAFDYWVGQFVYMRQIEVFTCDWQAYNAVIKAVQQITDPAARKAAAIAQGLPARISLMANFTTLVQDLLATVSGIEGSGTLYNVLSHSSWEALGPAPTALLEGLTGQSPLPPQALAPLEWSPLRAPLARVQTLRTMLAPGEPLRVRAFVLSPLAAPPTSVQVAYAPLGTPPGGAWATVALAQAASEAGVARYVYTGVVPPQAADFQWYLSAQLPLNASAYTEGLGVPAGTHIGAAGITLTVPPGGAAAPQTIVLTA